MFKEFYKKTLEAYKGVLITNLVRIIYDEKVVKQFTNPIFIKGHEYDTRLYIKEKFDHLGFWETFVLHAYLKLKLSENAEKIYSKKEE